MSDMIEKKISSETIYNGKILNLRVDTVELPNGEQGKREVVEYDGAVAIIALTPEKEVLMVRQYRYPAGRELLEIPAGKLERGEEPLNCAQRELKEETGAEAAGWKEIFSFYSSPGFCNEKMHLFLAEDLNITEQQLDKDEFVEMEKIPLNDVVQMVKEGKICDAKSVAGLLAAKEFVNY